MASRCCLRHLDEPLCRHEDVVEVEVRVQRVEGAEDSLRRHMENDFSRPVELEQDEVVLYEDQFVDQVFSGEGFPRAEQELVEMLRNRAEDVISESLTHSDPVCVVFHLNVAVEGRGQEGEWHRVGERPQHVLDLPCLLVEAGDFEGSLVPSLLREDQIVSSVHVEVHLVLADHLGVLLQLTLRHYLDAEVDVLSRGLVLLAEKSPIPERVHLCEASVRVLIQTEAVLELSRSRVPRLELALLG